MRPLCCTKVDGLPSCPQTKLPSVSYIPRHLLFSASLSIISFLSCIFNIPVSPLAFPLTLILLNHLLTFKTNKSTNQPTNWASKQPTNQLNNSQSYWSWDTPPFKVKFPRKIILANVSSSLPPFLFSVHSISLRCAAPLKFFPLESLMSSLFLNTIDIW